MSPATLHHLESDLHVSELSVYELLHILRLRLDETPTSLDMVPADLRAEVAQQLTKQ